MLGHLCWIIRFTGDDQQDACQMDDPSLANRAAGRSKSSLYDSVKRSSSKLTGNGGGIYGTDLVGDDGRISGGRLAGCRSVRMNMRRWPTHICWPELTEDECAAGIS
jgi:hypothetical protein